MYLWIGCIGILGFLGILTAGNHVISRSAGRIVAKQNRFPCEALKSIGNMNLPYKNNHKVQPHLRLDVLGSNEVVEAELPSPFESLF